MSKANRHRCRRAPSIGLSGRRGAALALAAALGVSGCSSVVSDAGARVGTGASDATAVGVTYLVAGQRGQPITLSGNTLSGEPWTNSAHVDQILVVNVWASWCGPCRGEAPILAALSAKYARSGITFVGIDTRDSDINGEAFVKTFAIPYPNLSDRSGQLLLALTALPPSAIPSTLVLDRRGRIAGRIIGPVTSASLSGLIDHVAAERPS